MHVQEMSWIVTDEWKGISPLLRNEFLHWSVNHSSNFVDPWTKFHTQAVERAWIEGKEWMRRARGPKATLQSHLDFLSWRLLRSGRKNSNTHDLFKEFWNDVHDLF